MRERLATTLTLTVGGTAHVIPGGNIRSIALRLEPWGAEGRVELVLQDDKDDGGQYEDALFADFQKPDLGELEISIAAVRSDSETAPTLPAIQTRGLLTRRKVSEGTFKRTLNGAPVLFRRYEVHFVDAARGLWKQHFPTLLYVEQSFQDVLDANKGDKITLTYDFTPLSTAVPLVFFHLPRSVGASFYDLLVWYLDKNSGGVSFDHTAGSYAIKGAKDASGTASLLPNDDVSCVTWTLAEPVRYAPRVLNVAADAPALTPITNDNAATSLYEDFVLCTDVSEDVDGSVSAETARVRAPDTRAELTFGRFPSVAVLPGSLISMTTGGGFSSTAFLPTGSLRVLSLSLSARANDLGPEVDYGDTATGFEVEVAATLENAADAYVSLPPFIRPAFPGYLEGKTVSSVGEDTDVTYDIVANETTSIDEYTVEVPAFESKQVKAPYISTQSTGTFFLPVYKNEKVRLACFFDRAEIVRRLDHRSQARVPQDGQGQHLLFGKSDTSQTSVLHDYQGEKPVLRVLRTNDKDTVLVRLEEGKLTLKVEETKGDG